MQKTTLTSRAAALIPAHDGATLSGQPAPQSQPTRARGRPRKTQSELDEGNRRQLIIEGAARLFRAKGFDAASTRDIAAAAGMRSGSPFYHFESKSVLLYVVMKEGMAQAARSQLAALARLPAHATAHERLRTLIRHHLEVLLGPDGDFIPVMLYEWRSLTSEQRLTIARLKDDYEAQWVPILQALHDSGALKARPGLARLFIFGALNWAVQWYSPNGPMTLDELTAQALTLFTGEV